MSERFSEQEKGNRETPLEAVEVESEAGGSGPRESVRKSAAPQLHQSALSDGAEEMDASDASVHILLSDSPNKTSFMFKVSVLLVLYFLFWVGIIAWGVYDQRNARIFYRSMKGKVVAWVLVGIVAMLKIIMGLAGRHMRGGVKLVYFLVLIGATLAMFGLYFFFEEVGEAQYVFNGIYVAIFAASMLGSAVGLFLSLGFSHGQTYNPAVGVVLMFIMNIAVSLLFFLKWDSVLLKLSKLVSILVFCFFADLYLAFETRQIIEYRAHKYFDTDIYLGFFSLWTDWFSFFWLDSLNHTKFMKRRAKKAKAAKQAKAEAKPAEEPKKIKQPAAEQKGAPSERPDSARPVSVSIRPSMVEPELQI